jgi:hypothetical protein
MEEKKGDKGETVTELLHPPPLWNELSPLRIEWIWARKRDKIIKNGKIEGLHLVVEVRIVPAWVGSGESCLNVSRGGEESDYDV